MTGHKRVRMLRTAELTFAEASSVRELLRDAFADDEDGQFTEDDWLHALGGVHFVLDTGGQIHAHAAVVQRELHVGDRPFRTGYVEAVAVAPNSQRRGLGTTVMREVARHIMADYELGALGTGSHAFYQRLGWQRWRGRSSVRVSSGLTATPDDDGYIMVLHTPRTPKLDLDAPISCEWRAGDVW